MKHVKLFEQFVDEGKSFRDFETAVKHHEEGNPYYDRTKIINLYNQLNNSDQQKAKKTFPKVFEEFVNNSLTESRAPKTKEELISALDDAYSKLDKYNTKYYEISTAPGGGSWSSNSKEGKKALKYKKMANNQQSNIWKWTDKLRKLGFEYDSKNKE